MEVCKALYGHWLVMPCHLHQKRDGMYDVWQPPGLYLSTPLRGVLMPGFEVLPQACPPPLALASPDSLLGIPVEH